MTEKERKDTIGIENEACDHSWAGVVQHHLPTEHQLPDLTTTPPDLFPPDFVRRLIYSREELFSLRYRQAASRRLLNHLETLGILIVPKQECSTSSTENILGEQASFPHLLSGLGLNLAFSVPFDSLPYSYSENKDPQFSLPGGERKTCANLTEVSPLTDNLAGRKDRPTVYLEPGNESLTGNLVCSEEGLVKGDSLTQSNGVENNGASAIKDTVNEPSAGNFFFKFTEPIGTALGQFSDHSFMAQTSSLSSSACIEKSVSQATEEAAWLGKEYIGGDVQSASSDESFESCPDVPCPAGNVDTCSDLISCSGNTAKVDNSESVNMYVDSVSREILTEVLDTVKEKIHNDAKQADIPRNSLLSEKAHLALASVTDFAQAECLAVKHETPKEQEAVSPLDEEEITSSLHDASVYAALHLDMPTNGSLEMKEIKTYNMQNPTAGRDYLLSRNLTELNDEKIHMYVEQRCFEPETVQSDDAGTDKCKIDAKSMLETGMVPTKTPRKKRRSKKKAASVEPDGCDPVIVPYENQSSVSKKSRNSSPMEEKAGSNLSNTVSSESGSLPSELSEASSVVTADDENIEEPVHTREENLITLEGVEGDMLSGRDFSGMSRAFVNTGSISEQGVCICQLLIQVFHEGCRYQWTGGQGPTRLSFLDHLFVVKDRVYQVQEEFGTPSPFMCPEHGVLPDCVQNSRCKLCSDDGSHLVSPSTTESVSSHAAQSESKIWPSFPVPIPTSLIDLSSAAAVYQPRAEELSMEGVSGDSKLSAEDKEKRKVLNKAGKKLLKLKSRIDKELGQWSDQIKEYLTLDTAAENCVDKAKEVLGQQLGLVISLLQQQHLLMLGKLEAEHKAYIQKFTKTKKKMVKYEKSLVKTQTAVQKRMDEIIEDRNTDAADAQGIAVLSTKFYSLLNTKPEYEITQLSVNVHMPDILKEDIKSILGNFDVIIVPQPSPKLLPASQALDKSQMKLKQIKKQPFTPPLWPGFERKSDGSSAPVKSTSALGSTKGISKSLNNLSSHTSSVNNKEQKSQVSSAASKKGSSSTDKSAKEKTVKVPLAQEKLSVATAEKQKKQTTKVEQQKVMDVKENPRQKLSSAKHDKIGASTVTSSPSKVLSVKRDKINSETVSPAHAALAPSLGKDEVYASLSTMGGATYSNMTKLTDFSVAGASSPGAAGMLASSVVDSSSWVRISPRSLFNAAASSMASLPETLSGPAKKKKKKSKKKKLAVAEESSGAVASDVAITRLRSVCVTASPKKIEVRGKEATGFAPRLGGEVWLVYGCRDPNIDLINERGELLETTRIGGNAWHAACFNDDHILVSFHSPCHLKLLDVKKLPKETFDLSFAPTGLGVGSTGIVTSSRKALYWISLDGDADKWVVNQEKSPLIDVCSCDVVITPVGTEIVCAADKGGHQVVFYEKSDGGTFVAWPSFAGMESDEHRPPPFTPICLSAHTSGLLAILDSGSHDVLMADLTEMHCRVISCIRGKQLCQGVPSIITFALKGSDEDPKLWVASNNGSVYLASLLFHYYDNLV